MARMVQSAEVRIPTRDAVLDATLAIPAYACGVVLFAHGSGSGRFSTRNRYMAGELQKAGFATVLLDLLTADEAETDARTHHLRFHVELLALRLADVIDWLGDAPGTHHLPIGCFGASTGAAAVLAAAAERPAEVRAVVSRGGRPDQAEDAMRRVRAPTLLIVGSLDTPVIGMNQDALRRMPGADVVLRIVRGATHLFSEPGTLQEVASLACAWFSAMLLDPQSDRPGTAGRAESRQAGV